MAEESEIRPLQPIRRFDVFAETKRLEALAHGAAEDVAKGYGIRIAKIVASRRYGGAKKTHFDKKPKPESEPSADERYGGESGSRFRALDGELQTDLTFDREIIERMGPEFYDRVFAPAIRETLAEGRKYETIRDTIRKNWKPVRA
jgi:hypothetical protein